MLLGKSVKVGSVDKELKILWEENRAQTNASLVNFVVYSEKEGDLGQNSQIIQRITRDHACRTILVGADMEKSDVAVESWITAHCHLINGKKSICSEQISFLIHGSIGNHLRNTVFAHLQSDLPVVFWWQGNLTERFDERLYSRIHRLLIDSSTWKSSFEQLKKIEHIIEKNHLIVQDLAWTRIYQIRHAVSFLFDNPAALEYLKGLERVEIECGKADSMAGMYLMAWVVESLSYAFESAQGMSFIYSSKTGSKVLFVIKMKKNLESVGKISFKTSEIKNVVEVSREEDDLLTQKIQIDQINIKSHHPADNLDDAEAIVNQLSRGSKNSLFRKTLKQLNCLS